MAHRHRSRDGSRDSDRFRDAPEGPSHAGRDGGRLAREIGTRDEEKRAEERPAGVTRVRKADEPAGARRARKPDADDATDGGDANG
jgi:hypothetical protein